MPASSIDGLPTREAIDRDVASLLGYAELLRDTIDRRLYPQGGTDLELPSSDRLFDDALRVVLERMLTDRLSELSAEQLLAAYRSVLGDDAFATVLQALASEQQARVERDTRVARLAREATVSGRLLLAELAAGEVLTTGLFDPARPELAARRFQGNQEVRPLHRVLQLRVVEPATGQVEVVRDTWCGAIWSESLRGPLAEPLTLGQLGTRPRSQPDAPLAAAITLHAPVVVELDDADPVMPVQIVGYVETLDGQVLLDG